MNTWIADMAQFYNHWFKSTAHVKRIAPCAIPRYCTGSQSLHVLLFYFIFNFDNCNICDYYIEVLRDKDEFSLII